MLQFGSKHVCVEDVHIFKHCHEITLFLLRIGTYCMSCVVQQTSGVKDMSSLVRYDDSSLAAIRHVQSIVPLVRPRPNRRSHSVFFYFYFPNLRSGSIFVSLLKLHSGWQGETKRHPDTNLLRNVCRPLFWLIDICRISQPKLLPLLVYLVCKLFTRGENADWLT